MKIAATVTPSSPAATSNGLLALQSADTQKVLESVPSFTLAFGSQQILVSKASVTTHIDALLEVASLEELR